MTLSAKYLFPQLIQSYGVACFGTLPFPVHLHCVDSLAEPIFAEVRCGRTLLSLECPAVEAVGVKELKRRESRLSSQHPMIVVTDFFERSGEGGCGDE